MQWLGGSAQGAMDPEQIEAALSEDRLFLLLQPVVGAQSLRPAFYEALARIRDVDGSVVPASAFIERAEHAGIVERIDRRTLQMAIALLTEQKGFDLSVNISSLTTSDFAWITELQALTCDRSGLLRRLIVEITETSAFPDINRTLAFVDALKELGCRVAIDDYGAGHTNLAQLDLLAPDIVKLDRSIAQRISAGAETQAFVETMIRLSQSRRFETVAEGIEDPTSAGALSQLGVTYLQGFYFGEPGLPRAALIRADQDLS